MLSGVGWLIVVWIIWIVIASVVLYLVRFAMNGQQEHVTHQETAINTWAVEHGKADPSILETMPEPEPSRPTQPTQPERPTPPPAPFGPPLPAT